MFNTLQQMESSSYSRRTRVQSRFASSSALSLYGLTKRASDLQIIVSQLPRDGSAFTFQTISKATTRVDDFFRVGSSAYAVSCTPLQAQISALNLCLSRIPANYCRSLAFDCAVNLQDSSDTWEHGSIERRSTEPRRCFVARGNNADNAESDE